MPRATQSAPMTSQTCTVCGKIGDRSSFSPVSGWDWYRDVRLCPEHARSHYPLIEAALKRAADEAAAEIKAKLSA